MAPYKQRMGLSVCAWPLAIMRQPIMLFSAFPKCVCKSGRTFLFSLAYTNLYTKLY